MSFSFSFYYVIFVFNVFSGESVGRDLFGFCLDLFGFIFIFCYSFWLIFYFDIKDFVNVEYYNIDFLFFCLVFVRNF